MKITRSEFKEYIEKSLPENSTEEFKARLRKVADEAPNFVTGTFWSSAYKCGCPLTQAGIYDPIQGFYDNNEFVDLAEAFYENFDNFDIFLHKIGKTYYEVID